MKVVDLSVNTGVELEAGGRSVVRGGQRGGDCEEGPEILHAKFDGITLTFFLLFIYLFVYSYIHADF